MRFPVLFEVAPDVRQSPPGVLHDSQTEPGEDRGKRNPESDQDFRNQGSLLSPSSAEAPPGGRSASLSKCPDVPGFGTRPTHLFNGRLGRTGRVRRRGRRKVEIPR
jgi:hypothetical protein